MSAIERFAAGFSEEPGYLDHPHISPIGQPALAEERALSDVLSRGRFGSFGALDDQDGRHCGVVR